MIMDRSSPALAMSPDILECRDPATGERLGEAPILEQAEVEVVIQRARRAQPAWARTSFRQRRKVLQSLLLEIVSSQDEICRLAVHDSGKTMVDAALGEVFPVCESLRHTIEFGERDLAPQRRSSGLFGHKSAEVIYEPLGVIGVIVPGHSPFQSFMAPIIPALFAGNAVVVKVSELATWSSLSYVAMVQDVLRDHGNCPELVQIVTGYEETGAALVTSGVDKVFFSGSIHTARRVMQAAACRLTPVVLQLSGKDPMVIFEDADLQHAVDSAMAGVFTACGQTSTGAERLYVQEAVYDRFVKMAEQRVRALRQGPPMESGVDCGATTKPGQLDVIGNLVDDAVNKGARVLVGGSRRRDLPGTYFEPTLLVDVDHSMRITQDEVFGPVMVIMKFRDEQHAIELANDCAYGLSSSVFTRDLARGARVSRQITAGMSVVNDHGLASMMPSLPFGGTKLSGFGRVNGREGLRACCNVKAVVSDRLPLKTSMPPYPIRAASYDLVESAMRAIYTRSLRARARAAVDAARNLVNVVRESRKDER